MEGDASIAFPASPFSALFAEPYQLALPESTELGIDAFDPALLDKAILDMEALSLPEHPVSAPLSPYSCLSPPPPRFEETTPSSPMRIPPKPNKSKVSTWKPFLQVLTFDAKKIPSSLLAKERNQYAKRLKNAIDPALKSAFHRKERLTIYVVPESLESGFSPFDTQKGNGPPPQVMKKLIRLLDYACDLRKEITDQTEDEEDSEDDNSSLSSLEGEDVEEKKVSCRKRKKNIATEPRKKQALSLPPIAVPTGTLVPIGRQVKKSAPSATLVLPPLPLPLLIYTRLKHPNKYFPEKKLYAVLHRLQHPTEEKGHKRFQGCIFVPAIQKDVESLWKSMKTQEERYQWSLSEKHCPLRVRKFSEVVKYTLSHPPYSEEMTGPAAGILKDLPPGPKLWFVCHESFGMERISIFECAHKIVSNPKFDPDAYKYGALSKGRIKGPVTPIYVPITAEISPRNNKKDAQRGRRMR